MIIKIVKIYTLILFISLWSCNDKGNEKTTVEPVNKEINDEQIVITQAQFDQNKMMLGSLEDKAFPKFVNTTGMIDVPPENKAVVSAKMGGYIKTTPLLNGDTVKKGQVLVTIENPEFVTIQQQYLEIHEELTYLKAEFDRQTLMKSENITSQKSFLKAESNYKTAVARYAGLKKQLQLLNISTSRVEQGNFTSVATIYAPISGSISKINITKGSFVSPASEIMEIIDNNHIHLELSVFEKDILNIKKDQEIDFKIPEASSKIYKAKVHLVGTAIDENRTIKVHGHLLNEEENNFLVGMFVEASIVTDSEQGKALPSQSIVEVENEYFVLVLDKKEGDTYYFNQKKIEMIRSYNGNSMIGNMGDFKEGTKFLTKGAFNLLGE